MNDFNKDPLEMFVQEHRDDFDLHEPNLDLWNRIEGGLPPEQKEEKPIPKMVPLKWVLRIAAMITVILGAGLLLFFQGGGNSPIRWGNVIALQDISPEMAEVEQHYMALIEAKLTTLKSSNVLNSNDYQSLLDEIEALDRDYEQLKRELIHSLDKEKIIEAMIQNYRLRLQILEKMLKQIHKDSDLNPEKEEQDDGSIFL